MNMQNKPVGLLHLTSRWGPPGTCDAIIVRAVKVGFKNLGFYENLITFEVQILVFFVFF